MFEFNFAKLGKDEKKAKATLVLHNTAYDGAVELACVEMGLPCVSCSVTHDHFKAAKDVVKDNMLKASDVHFFSFFF